MCDCRCRMAENYESTVTAEAEGNHEEEMTWNDLTVPQLKEELIIRGLETTGKKAELVARLEKYDSGAVFISVFGRPYYRSSLWYSMSSVCRLSVCRLSVTFCIVAKRCVLAKKCLKE